MIKYNLRSKYMKIVILFDSVFGNTEKVAASIKESLQQSGEIILSRFDGTPSNIFDNTDILILGSPTRAFSPTKQASSFVKNLAANELNGIRTASFDTRINIKDENSKFLKFMVNLFGYAAEPLQKMMIKKGGISAGSPEGFHVKGTEGPMANGELERASVWALSLIRG
jgi:flavodoxin I